MPKAQTRPEAKEEKAGRIDTVRPPPNLPDTSPLERMTELVRRVVAVPKTELNPKQKKRRRGN